MKGEFTQKGREALDRFKMESASEMGVNLKQGYNGDLTAREAGSIGGQMVNMMGPEQQWVFVRKGITYAAEDRVLTVTVQCGI